MPINPQQPEGGGGGEGDDERYQDPDTETGLFNTAPYEQDDEEAGPNLGCN